MIDMPEVNYTYYAKLKRVIDGDTAEFDIDLGFNVHTHVSVRFKDFNAPEMHGPNKAAGQAAKAELETLLSGHSVILKTDKLNSQSFARYLALVYVGTADGWKSVAEHMREKGFHVKQGQ